MLDNNLFIRGFTGLCELFDKTVSDSLTDIYYESLKSMSDDEFKAAVNRIITTAKFFPKPADFLETLRIDESAQAIMAYEKAINAGQQYGAYRSVQFDDPAIHSTIELMGGWQKFCLSEDERKWQQKEFEEIYQVMRRRGEHPKYLPGQVEQVNALKGCEIPPPVAIGRKQLAAEIERLEVKNE